MRKRLNETENEIMRNTSISTNRELTWEEMEEKMKKTLSAIGSGHDAPRVIKDLYYVQHIKVENGEMEEDEFNDRFEQAIMDTIMTEFNSTPKMFRDAVRPKLEALKEQAKRIVQHTIDNYNPEALPDSSHSRELPRRQRMIESLERKNGNKGFGVPLW